MEQLKCKLAEYVVLYSAKIMWGLDCDVPALLQEINKINYYIQVLESLQTTNTCTTKIPTSLIQKINAYKAALARQTNKTCRNC